MQDMGNLCCITTDVFAGAFTVRGEEGVEFHSLGQVAREVSGANELWLALVLTHEALQTLGPPQLAGGCGP